LKEREKLESQLERDRRSEKEEPKFFGRPSAAAAVEGPEIWTFAL